MAVKKFKPTTSTRRFTTLMDRSHLSVEKLPSRLLYTKKKNSGRNNQGKVTVRHRGGGFKRKIRVVDYKREKFGIEGKVVSMHFDPNRNADLALIQYVDGDKRLIIANKGMQIGDKILSGELVDSVNGNRMKLKNIQSGTPVNNVELVAGRGAQIARSAGTFVVVQGPDATGKYIQCKMPSGEIRLINKECYATIGTVGTEDFVNVSYGKAGRKRNLGWRPSVRGMVMHPNQHPHGGGEGKGVIGRAKDKWGNRLHIKTRKNKRTSRFIVRTRPIKQRPDRK